MKLTRALRGFRNSFRSASLSKSGLFIILCGLNTPKLIAQALIPFNVPPQPDVLAGKIHSGKIRVEPETGIAGEYGTWTVTYEAGETIHPGGGIRVQLPEAWHAGQRNSANRLQATAPTEPNFVWARCSNRDVVLQTTVEHESPDVLVKSVKPSNLTRRMGYYVFVVRAVVLKGELRQGDSLSLIYGDTTRGSKGMRAAIISSRPEPILVAVDTEGRGTFRLHAATPMLTAKAGLPVEMLLTVRSDAVVGEPTVLRCAVLDQFGNAASSFAGPIELKLRTGQAEFPARVQFEADRGWAEMTFVPKTEGLLRFEAFEPARKLEAYSNPVRVHREKPPRQIYWGDLHSHTRYSASDAVGNPEGAYEYARHISALDFYAMTDHTGPVEPITNRLTDQEWDEYTRLAERFNVPGQFVTLHAYECSLYAPYGHHNVYFRDQPGPLLNPDTVTLPELWKALKQDQALTIPHHTLKMPEPIDWSAADNAAFRRNFEIYSGHGLSEEYDPTHPLAYEQSLFTNPSKTTKTGMSATRAWSEGFELSTIASSDDHRAQPGQPQYGLAAVRSHTLTRNGIFDALQERQTYATTGARIILEFTIGQTPMGGRTKVNGPVAIHGRALGTDIIDRVEILRHTKAQPGFKVIHQLSPADEVVAFDFVDRAEKGAAIYYVRLRQRHLVRERVAMAWSSPIWVDIE